MFTIKFVEKRMLKLSEAVDPSENSENSQHPTKTSYIQCSTFNISEKDGYTFITAFNEPNYEMHEYIVYGKAYILNDAGKTIDTVISDINV